jgi:hypothetical protein
VIATDPAVNCEPATVSVAVEDKPVDATRFAEPSVAPCEENVTTPVGALPLELVTVAVRIVLPLDCAIVCGLAVRLMDVVGPVTLAVDHDVARL